MVATPDSLGHLLGLAAAAEKKGIELVIFLTGDGVLLTQEPGFAKLAGRGRMSLCEVSFRGHGLKGEAPGMGFKDFATQARHAEMLEDCPHYIML